MNFSEKLIVLAAKQGFSDRFSKNFRDFSGTKKHLTSINNIEPGNPMNIGLRGTEKKFKIGVAHQFPMCYLNGDEGSACPTSNS